MVENALQQLIYGRAVVNEVPAETPDVLALSGNIKPDVARVLRNHIPITPQPVAGILASQAVALLPFSDPLLGGDTYILARAHFQRDERVLPVYQYIVIQPETLTELGGDLEPLVRLINTPIPSYAVTHAPLDPLTLSSPTTWTLDKSIALLNSLLIEQHSMTQLLRVLDAALTGGVIINNFTNGWRDRLALVRGLRLLLPLSARQDLSFTTHAETLNNHLPHIAFSENNTDAPVTQIDWQQSPAATFDPESAYVAHLQELWQGDVSVLLQDIRAMDVLAVYLLPDYNLVEGLAHTATRHQQDLTVTAGGNLSVDELKQVVSSPIKPTGELRLGYMERLLQHALDERDTELAEYLAEEFDSDPELDKHVHPLLVTALDEQPDDLYVFTRTRLAKGIEERWLVRLQAAAALSLTVALQSGDAHTLSSWLTLIGREPLRYELGDVLHKGILAARPLAEKDADLALQLLTLAVKRQPDTLPELIHNEQVLAPLPDEILAALQDYDSDALLALAENHREIFLLMLTRALDTEQAYITPAIIRALWDIHTQQKTNMLPPQFRPTTIMQQLAADGTALTEGALEVLLTLMLKDHEDEAFFELVPALTESEQLEPVLVTVLQQCGRTGDEILYLLSTLVSNEFVHPQTAIDTYVAMLSHQDWDEALYPLIEQLGRSLNQYTDTTAPASILWKLAEVSANLKNEQILRATTRRLLTEIDAMLAESQVIESIIRLRKAVQWSNAGRTLFMRWWREYVRQQPLTRLQKIEKELDGIRNIDEMRAILQTVIALRRVIGTQGLQELADAVNITYKTLQALSEAFDPHSKTPINVDSNTLRNEIAARKDEIATDSRYALATNLKELAQLITTLAENRSKGFMRSDDSVERQLVIGEQEPQSAIDVMRWLSGYLDGMQRDED